MRLGATLYDALGAEPGLREARARAVLGHVDNEFVEASIREAAEQVHVSVAGIHTHTIDLRPHLRARVLVSRFEP
jgi:clusterin-associated protein 1